MNIIKIRCANMLDSARLHQNTEPWQNETMIIVLTKCEAREAPFFLLLVTEWLG